MKKVYLVYASIFYEDGSHYVVLLNVFASAIKAEVYANYKRLTIVYNGASDVFGNGVDSAVVRVECESICTVDWSAELKKLQDAKSDANRIVEVKSNYQLTKKSNLLDFV